MENHLAKADGKSHPEVDGASRGPGESVAKLVTNLDVGRQGASHPAGEEDHLADHLAKRKALGEEEDLLTVDPTEGEEDLLTEDLAEGEEDHPEAADNADHPEAADVDQEVDHRPDRSEGEGDEDLLNRVTLSGD